MELEDEKRKKADATRKANAILRNIAFHVASLTGGGTGDLAIFEELGTFTTAGIVTLMSSSMSCGGLIELLFTQGVGGLTDRFGRKWGFLVYPSYCTIGGLAVFLFPKNLNVLWYNRMFVWSLGAVFGGLAHSGAAISDLASGEVLAAAYSKIFMYIGAGVLVGLTVGSKAHQLFGAKYAHLARSVFGLIQLYHNYYYLEETLSIENRNPKPLTLQDVNPLKCLQLFTYSRGLSLTTLTLPLAHCAEGKHTADIRSAWMAYVLKMPLSMQGWFMNYWSSLAVLGGYAGAISMKKLGRRTFTTMTNVLTAIGFYMVSIPQRWASWFGYALMLPGFNANHCAGMKAFATDLAVAHGIGRGDFAASVALLRGASVVFAPTIYSYLFSSQMKNGQIPRKAWWAVILLGAILPEICHQLLNDDDLDVERIKEERMAKENGKSEKQQNK
jgi:MFS family permease